MRRLRVVERPLGPQVLDRLRPPRIAQPEVVVHPLDAVLDVHGRLDRRDRGRLGGAVGIGHGGEPSAPARASNTRRVVARTTASPGRAPTRTPATAPNPAASTARTAG